MPANLCVLIQRVRVLSIAQDAAPSDQYHAYSARITAAANTAMSAGAQLWEVAEAAAYDAP